MRIPGEGRTSARGAGRGEGDWAGSIDFERDCSIWRIGRRDVGSIGTGIERAATRRAGIASSNANTGQRLRVGRKSIEFNVNSVTLVISSDDVEENLPFAVFGQDRVPSAGRIEVTDFH